MSKKINYRIQVENKTRFEIKSSGDTAVIKIIGEINWYQNNSEEFTQQLEGLKAAGITNLKLYLNSPGGSVLDANEIYNQLIAFEGTKSVQVGAICASSAMIILLAFPKENASCATNTMGMIHKPTLSIIDGDEDDLQAALNLLSKTEETITNLLAPRMGLSTAKVSNLMAGTFWMTAADLKQYGFVSSIDGQADDLPDDTIEVANKYRFAHLPEVINKATQPPTPNQETKPKKHFMKNLFTLLMTAVPALKELVKNHGGVKNTDEPEEAEIVALVSRGFQERDEQIATLTNQLTAEKKSVIDLNAKIKDHETSVVKAALDLKEESQAITKEQRKELEALVPSIGVAGLTSLLNTMKPRTNLRNAIELGNQQQQVEGQKAELPKPKNMVEMVARKIAELNSKQA